MMTSSIVILDVPVRTAKDVEKLELESKLGEPEFLKKFEVEKGVKYTVDGTWREETDQRVKDSDSIAIVIDPAKPTELRPVKCSFLPHSYLRIRNSLWIDRQPVYKAALVEWSRDLAFYSSKVERKISKVESLKNEIYKLIGFYSVFQGVLVTASSQTSLLRCRIIGIPVTLSLCASLVTLFGILQVFGKIHELDSSIFFERIEYKEAFEKICRLKEQGEGFRFHDVPNSESEGQFERGPGWIVVTLAVSVFSIVFILTHPLILCGQ